MVVLHKFTVITEFPFPKGLSSVLFHQQNIATGVEQLEQRRVLFGRQAKVMEAREVAAGPLSEQLLTAVAENERLNRQLHGLHNSAAALRQAIADARSLQMHLQQEAADAREPPLSPPTGPPSHRPLAPPLTAHPHMHQMLAPMQAAHPAKSDKSDTPRGRVYKK